MKPLTLAPIVLKGIGKVIVYLAGRFHAWSVVLPSILFVMFGVSFQSVESIVTTSYIVRPRVASPGGSLISSLNLIELLN
ncbi:MAG: hypothetical protein ABW119_22965, partial [Candidatus Thiodiazotropha lotti]